MNTALILAGGVGERMQKDVPKQFYTVFDKPIIIYTLELFQNHDEIDVIDVICLDGWQKVLETYAWKFGIAKLRSIVSGGSYVHESIYNGVIEIEKKGRDSDIIMLHDAVRPLIKPDIISDCISVCKKKGNAVAATPHIEQIFWIDGDNCTRRYIPRELVTCIQTPQAYYLKTLSAAYEKAYKEDPSLIPGSLYANNLMVDVGETLYFSKGSSSNIKITTPDDIDVFRAIIRERERESR